VLDYISFNPHLAEVFLLLEGIGVNFFQYMLDIYSNAFAMPRLAEMQKWPKRS
jgi:hypothetical protein